MNFLGYYAFKTDIILDPFMGSGTTAIAVLKSDRKYIGFEISEEYIELTKQRVKSYENMMQFD